MNNGHNGHNIFIVKEFNFTVITDENGTGSSGTELLAALYNMYPCKQAKLFIGVYSTQ